MPKQLRYLVWFFRVLVFLLLLSFALHNLHSVSINFFLNTHWAAPLSVVLLVAFILGIGAGLMTGFAHRVRIRRDMLQAKREVRELRNRRQIEAVRTDPAPAASNDLYDAI